MAGAMHSFMTGHRQGDICRVAVHDPFTAEIVGYQYRDNRAINRDVVGAAAAIVVEHDFRDAWSGIVVRRIEDMDDEEPEEKPEDTKNEESAAKGDSTEEKAPAAPATQSADSSTQNGSGGSSDGGTGGNGTGDGKPDDTEAGGQ